MDELKKLIREVPDFPKPGINFYDITTLLKDAEGLKQTIDALADNYKGEQIDTVIGVESRGFILALRRIPAGNRGQRPHPVRPRPCRCCGHLVPRPEPRRDVNRRSHEGEQEQRSFHQTLFTGEA